jgi:hypothetical protein
MKDRADVSANDSPLSTNQSEHLRFMSPTFDAQIYGLSDM